MNRPGPVLVVVTIAYLALVVWVTLGAVPWDTAPNESPWGVLNPRAWLSRDTWMAGSRLEIVANVVMFVPVGLLFRMLTPRRSAWPALFGAAAFTLAIELAQIPSNRVSDPRDLVANGAGAVLGVLVGSLVVALRRPRSSPRSEPRRDLQDAVR